MFDKLIDVILSVLHWFQFWTICNTEHRGFIRRFGVPVRDLHPGWNWVLPCVETSTHVDMRLWADVLPAQSLRTKDGVDFVVKLMVSHQVLDPRVFTLAVYDANNNIQDVAAGHLGSVFARSTAEDVYSGAVLRKVRAAVVRAAVGWGLTIHKVQFVDCSPAPSYRLFGVQKDD